MQIKLQAYFFFPLGVAGCDTSWCALLMHLRQRVDLDPSEGFREDMAIVTRSWTSIRLCFRGRGVCTPQQLILNTLATPVVWLLQERLSRDPAWLEPLALHRALSSKAEPADNCNRTDFPCLIEEV